MPNLIKNEVMDAVKQVLKVLNNIQVSWPDHSSPGIGFVPAGSDKIEIRDSSESLTLIIVRQSNGVSRWFRVKVSEMC
jgi:hypothetical protein